MKTCFRRQGIKRLAALAGGLRFVKRCYTRVVRRSDGAEAGDALKVSYTTALASMVDKLSQTS